MDPAIDIEFPNFILDLHERATSAGLADEVIAAIAKVLQMG